MFDDAKRMAQSPPRLRGSSIHTSLGSRATKVAPAPAGILRR
ncbi:hypothetical protein ABZ322_18840 [Streptomyces sp. NPDC006129]